VLSLPFTQIDWMMNYLLFVLCRCRVGRQDLTDVGRLRPSSALIHGEEVAHGGYGRRPTSSERDRQSALPASQWRRNVWDGLKIFTEFNGARRRESRCHGELPLGAVNGSIMTVYRAAAAAAAAAQQSQQRHTHTGRAHCPATPSLVTLNRSPLKYRTHHRAYGH